jgi:hypothetical protein
VAVTATLIEVPGVDGVEAFVVVKSLSPEIPESQNEPHEHEAQVG